MEIHITHGQIAKLKKKLCRKRVLIYGTGKFFHRIYKDFNLAELNIIGVVDRKYESNRFTQGDFGYKIVHLNEIRKQNADCILICLENPYGAETQLKPYLNKNKIIALNKKSPLSSAIYNLSLQMQKIINRKNFVLIKQDGTKIYNPKIKNLKVNLRGENPRVEIYEPFEAKIQCEISCADNSLVRIHPYNTYQRARILAGCGNTIEIGACTTIGEACFYLSRTKHTKVKIGQDCMLSSGIIIRTSDGHKISDKDGNMINPPQDVIISDHVWVGARSMILKGTEIPSNCIVGACTLVNKKFKEENCIIAGVPAKIVKRNINWDRNLPPGDN